MGNIKKGITKWWSNFDKRFLIIGTIMLWFFLYWGNIQTFVNEIDHCPILFCDFNGFYYPAGKALLTQGPFPTGFYYSTFAAIIFSPFAFFSLQTGSVMWGIILLFQILFLFLAYSNQLPKVLSVRYLITFVFFTNVAILHNFKWGQVSVLLSLGTFLAFLLYKNHRWVLSAILLGIAISFKYYPVIFMIYFFFKKDWKYLFLCSMTVVTCLIIIPAIILGLDETFNSQYFFGDNAYTMVKFIAFNNTGSQYFASVITRIVDKLFNTSITKVSVTLGYLVVLLAFYLVFRISKAKFAFSDFWAWGILSATIPFLVPSTWSHYFAYLPFLQALTFHYIPGIQIRWRMYAIVLWVTSVIFSNIILVQIVQNWFLYTVLGLLFWSNFFMVLLLGIILAPILTRRNNTSSLNEKVIPTYSRFL